MTVLVYGATGTQGKPVALQLLARGAEVRAVTRSWDRAGDLAAAGAEVVEADLNDVAALATASKGVDAAFLQIPAGATSATLVQFTRNALEALRSADVAHIVMTTSGVVPPRRTGVPYADAKLEMVGLIDDLAPHAVLLHPGIYLDNLTGPLRPAIEQGVLPYPMPAVVPVAWLSAEDAATFAVEALQRPALAGRRFRIAGAELLTGPQLASLISEARGAHVRYEAIAPSDFGAQLAPLLGEAAATEIAALYEWQGQFGADLLAPVEPDTLAALPIELTPIATWLATRFSG